MISLRACDGADRERGEPRTTPECHDANDRGGADRDGLRANDALHLAFDALSHDASGAPYLRYVNHKLARERYIPISEQLAARVRGQQAWVRETYPPSCPHLLPRGTANPDGAHPGSYNALIVQLRTWQRACDIREADGTVPRVTPHRFRHTLATRMINRDVPEIAVQQMLDHNSPEMTRVYAKLHDSTLREHCDRYQERISVRGEVVELDPAGRSATPRGPRRGSLARS